MISKMKSAVLFLFVGLMAVLSINLASATIILSDINPVYNLGDSIKIDAKVSQAGEFQGFFRISLKCDVTESLMYFSPLELEGERVKTISINYPVTTTGACHITAILEDNRGNVIEETTTSLITLSNKIDIELKLNKQEFPPEDTLTLTGTATKENGQLAQGIAIITFDKEYSTQVSGGKFTFNLKLEPDVTPGERAINVVVKDNSNNSGNVSTTAKILSIPTALIIETNQESFIPDTLLMITPKLLDQASGILKSTATVKLSKQVSVLKTELLLEELVESGNSTFYRITKYTEPGNYLLEASADKFNVKKTIIVERYEKISVDLKDSILYISNIGNVPFKQKIEVEFLIEGQSTKKIIDLDLDIGEFKQFRLEAPKGTYEIKVNTGSEILDYSQVPLTGFVIATVELTKSPRLDLKWLIGIIVLVVLLAIVLIFIKLHKSKKVKQNIIKMVEDNKIVSQSPTTGATGTATKKPVYLGRADSFSSSDTTTKKIFERHSSKLAASSVVPAIVYGTKQEITALFIHLGISSLNDIKKKDPVTYAKILDEYFAGIVSKIKEHQGVADLYGNDLIVLFNVIKQYRHDTAALKTAEAIKKVTEELNVALAPKGISVEIRAGINTGMANVSSIQNETVKYTSIGDTTYLAKALQAKALTNEILFTETIYERAANVIKAKKMQPYYLSEQQAINIYSLEDTTKAELRDKNQWYIRRALGKA